MPTYLYYCPIHKNFEVQQSIKEEALNSCPQCILSDENKTDFHCTKCDARWGLSREEKLSKVCKSCGLHDCVEKVFPKPKRLISATSFILQGGGWARDNYSK